MSDDNISLVTAGKVGFVSQVNQYFNALKESFYPRTSAGIVTDLAGSLGDLTRRWLNVFTKTLTIKGANTSATIEQTATDKVTILSATKLGLNGTSVDVDSTIMNINSEFINFTEGDPKLKSATFFSMQSQSAIFGTEAKVLFRHNGKTFLPIVKDGSSASTTVTEDNQFFLINTTIAAGSVDYTINITTTGNPIAFSIRGSGATSAAIIIGESGAMVYYFARIDLTTSQIGHDSHIMYLPAGTHQFIVRKTGASTVDAVVMVKELL